MVRDFECPVNVSPLIRISRWCMLLAGIGYGAWRHHMLQGVEDERRRSRESAMQMRNIVRPRPENVTGVGDKVFVTSRDEEKKGPFDLSRDDEQSGSSDPPQEDDQNGPSFGLTGPADIQAWPSDPESPVDPTGPPELPPPGPKGSSELPPSGPDHGPLGIPPVDVNNEPPTVSAELPHGFSMLAGEYHHGPLLTLYLGLRGSDPMLFGFAARPPPAPSDGQS